MLWLIFSVIFGSLSIITPVLHSESTYAVEESPSVSPSETPNPTETPDQPTDTPTGNESNPNNNQVDPENPDDQESSDNPDDSTDGENSEENREEAEEEGPKCSDQAGSLSWAVCPVTEFVGFIIDNIYGVITNLLVVKPLSTDTTSPIYIIWQYVRSITNIIFVIFLLIVIISQITGLGINNYGIKRILPRLIIAVILVNLSYLICTLAVDLSNIIGARLIDFLNGVQGDIMTATAGTSQMPDFTIASVVAAIIDGGVIAGLAIGFTGGFGHAFYVLLLFIVGGLVAVISGLVTLAARQALVSLLIMIAPLAFIAYLLPNTEKWFEQWKNLLFKMLIFYPMFSFLYGASKLIGWTVIISATEPIFVIFGLAIQIFPLFFSWSLMKMSGTILNAVNTGVRKALAPVQRPLSDWASEHAEHQRQLHFAKDAPISSRLRGYLDTRREKRANETRNAMEIRHDRAVTDAMISSSSIIGRGSDGKLIYARNPNRQTRTAKTANFWHTKATAAASTYQNTVSGYGDIFTNDRAAQFLNAQGGEAYVDSFTQQLRAKNQAEADQKWLLDKYLAAVNTQWRDPHEFNRLVADAAGGLGQDGEASIMGQVIYESSNIENRRRTEARIIATKFGVSKVRLRGMVFDKAYINDNGYETDADGTVIEDQQYNIIKYHKDGTPTKYKHTPWQQYIGVHKTTGNRIDKATYDSLSDAERKEYQRVKYFTIENDVGDPVQYVYDTDAGYMKELLLDDIAIGDPINLRYASEIGVANAPHEKTGILRRYHSTIANALFTTGYKEHDGTMTPMVTSQINNGFVTSKAQLNIARIQSLNVAAKAGYLLKSDGRILDELREYIEAATNPDKFAFFFPDLDVDSYRNVNGLPLDGLRLAVDANGNQYWKEINHNNPNITVEDKKNYLRHKVLPKSAAKFVDTVNKNLTQNVIDNMKPDGRDALIRMRESLSEIAKTYDGEDVDFEDRFVIHDTKNGDHSIFESPDPSILKAGVRATQKELGINPITGLRDTPNPYRRNSYNQLLQRDARREEAEMQRIHRNSYETIHECIDGYFTFINDYDLLGEQLLDYFREIECLRIHADECERLINEYRDNRSASTEDAIHDMAHRQELDQDRINQLRLEINQLLNNVNYEG